MKRTLLVSALMLTLVGCGEPKIDGKSEKTLQDSLAKVNESLPEAKRKQFSESVAVIATNGMKLGDILSGKTTVETTKMNALNSLDGKTADEVISEAGKIRAEREAKEKQQALAEVGELLSKKESAEKDKSELSKFTVSKSRFSMKSEEFISQKRPIIEMTVSNGTSQAVSRAYFVGTIASPGRAVPWYSDSFNYDIKGGLEPGEHADWTLAPNMFSEWGKVDAPADAVFTVEVVRIDGADKKAIFDSRKFTEADQKRLDALQQKYSSN